MMRLSAQVCKCVRVCECVSVRGRPGGRAGERVSERATRWMWGDRGGECPLTHSRGALERYMRAQACRGLDAHMVDVICWSLLQTRRCCVELTNSPVTPAGVWFELSPLSPGLGCRETGERRRGGKCGAASYRTCFSSCRFIKVRGEALNESVMLLCLQSMKADLLGNSFSGLLPSVNQRG